MVAFKSVLTWSDMIPDFTCPRACTPESWRDATFSRCTCKHTLLSPGGISQHPSDPPSLFHRNVLLVSERLGNPTKMFQERGHLVQLHQAVCLRFVLPCLLLPWALFQLILVDLVFLEHLHPNTCRVATINQSMVTSLRSLAPSV